APLLTPAAAAMSATRVPSYPRSAKTSAAARSSRSRVSAAVTPAIRPITELKERSSDSSRPQLLLADGRKRGWRGGGDGRARGQAPGQATGALRAKLRVRSR